MRGEDGDDERLESEKREKEDEEGDQVCQVDRRKRGSLQHEDEEKEEERKEGGTCDDRKTIASAHEDGSKESEEEKKKKEGGVEVRVLQESSPGSSIEFDKGETEMKKEEKKTMNLDDNNDTQSDRGSGSLSGVCTPHASTMTSRANTADVDSLLSRQKEKEHPHEEEDEGRTTESQGEKHSLFCKGGVEGRRDTSSSLSSESSSLLLSSTRNDDIASLSTAIAPQASRATVNSQKEEKEENKTSRGKKTDTIASSGKKEETIDSSGKEKETFGSSKMSKSIPSEKETSSFSSISSQTPSSHPPAYRPAVHAATERILRNFERQIDSTRSLSDTKQNTLGDYRAASYNPFGNRASRCDFLQADLPLTSPSLQVLQEDTQISRIHKRDMGLKTVAALSSVVRTSPKSRSFLGGDQALNRSTRRSYQRDGKGERDGVTDKKQEGDEYDRYLYLTRHHRSSPSPPSHVDSRHPHTGDRKQKKDPSSSSSATTTTTVAGGARSFSPVFTARQSGGGDSHGSPSYDDDEASQNSSVVGRSTVTTAALKTLFSPNALILPSQQDLRSRAKKRIKFLKNFHIWRAVSSIKIRSISAGQEHSLLLLDVEYLEGSLESFFTSS
ncbi:hypothetical protein CSUI_004593 [Cystoisospora suis]|uniref:Uncharacterized protein n=1 Tax=Cystoisospora suis TaxID=483139 RepID=A0A2C6L0Y3_9APIC|nr:hypothetical protein CSUI_004593 [Cystoisospora suis]